MSAKVLFVDDDDANLVVCEAACGDDFDVLTATSAEEALSHLRREEVGVIVADQRMPGTSGVELLERVRVEYPDTVRLLITAYTDVQAAVAAINRGRVRRYLRKPWEPEELRAELTDALDVYAMSRKLSALEVRLRETERVYALGVVAASIAHEMKNPMQWVTNSLSFAQRELRRLAEQPLASSIKQQLEEVEASLTDTRTGVDRVVDIVRGVEMPTRSDSGQLRPTDLAEVLRLGLRLVSGELMRCASLELDVTCAPKVRASSTKLGQVVLNLIVNAMQAVATRPRSENVISVRLRMEDAWSVLEVADNGPGIPEDDRLRIFDPFFTSKVGVGTGLGLAISRRIVEEIGGSLTAGRDERLGGASFVVRLPL
ncbi:MAG: hybrid sensor histidine kinase/response regulator [Myxococcales bacterium]|nr:MAG: hybrid sensor histidine kinase/response regulator [Myxococcales bacterium]